MTRLQPCRRVALALFALLSCIAATGQNPSSMRRNPFWSEPGATPLTPAKPLDRGVLAARGWLLRHLAGGDHWDTRAFAAKCKGARCTGAAAQDHDLAATALAAMALAEGGTTLRQGTEKRRYKTIMKWLIDRGGYGKPNLAAFPGRGRHERALATRAIAQAGGRARYTILRRPVEKCFLSLGAPETTPITVWDLLVAETLDRHAKAYPPWAGFSADRDKAIGRWLAGNTRAASRPEIPELDSQTVGLARALFNTLRTRSPLTVQSRQRLTLLLRSPSPEAKPIDPWSLYFGTRLLAVSKGPLWRKWRQAIPARLLEAQATQGCAKGSWPPTGPWGKAFGRVYVTALTSLILLHCRDNPVAPDPAPGAKKPPQKVVRPYNLDLCVYRLVNSKASIKYVLNGMFFYDRTALSKPLKTLYERFAATAKGVPSVTLRTNRYTTKTDIDEVKKLVQMAGYKKIYVE